MFSFVGSLFYFCFLFFMLVLFCFFCCLLYCLSHHPRGRVHDSYPMGGYDSDSSVGPGFFSSTRRGVLFFSFLCSLFDFFFGVFICFFVLALSPYKFLFFCLFVSLIYCVILVYLYSIYFYFFVLLCLSFFSLSVCRGSWPMHIVAWRCTTAVYLVQRSCPCRSFATTQLASLG